MRVPARARELPGYLRELDGLRGIAIGLVLVRHFWLERGQQPWLDGIANYGWMGVDLFFVISGFLITGILLHTKGRPGFFRNFYARRVIRIFPLYYLFVGAIFVALPLARGWSLWSNEVTESSGPLLWYLLYVQNIYTTVVNHDTWHLLSHLWSLAIEEQFYLVFPLLVASASVGTVGRVLAACMVAAPLLRLLGLAIWPENDNLQYRFTLARLDVLAAGCLLGLAFNGHLRLPSPARLRQAGWAVTAGFALALAWGGLAIHSTSGRGLGPLLTAVMMAVVVAWVVDRRGAAATAPLRWGPLCYMGKLCYGIYVLHRAAALIVSKLVARAGLPIEENTLPMFALHVAGAVAAATFSWYLFEKPVLRLKDRFFAYSRGEQAKLAVVSGV